MNAQPSAQIVNDLSRALLGEAQDVETVLSIAAKTLSRVRAGTWLAIAMCDDIATSRVVVADDSDPNIAEYIRRYMASLKKPGYAPTAGLSEQVIDSGEPLLLPSIPVGRFIDHMTPAAREWMAREPLPVPAQSAGVLMVPMHANGRIMGTLGLIQWNPIDLMNTDDVDWMQPIADRIGLAVDDVQNRISSLVRLERLSALHRVAIALASSQDLRLTLTILVEQLAATLPADAVDLLVVDDAAQEFRVAAAVGFHSTSMPDYRLPAAPLLRDLAVLGEQPRLAGSTQRRSLFAREGFREHASTCVLVRGRLVGVLEAFHRSELELDAESLGFLDAMGTNAAVAIDNSQMQDRLERVTRAQPLVRQPPADMGVIDRKVLAMVCEGATNAEIAEQVHLSIHTVKFHVRRLRDRLSAANRTELALKATRLGWN
jgi:DNA-binding CsgD family transcriptional regulator